MQINSILVAKKNSIYVYGLESLKLTQRSKVTLETDKSGHEKCTCSCTAFKVVNHCIHTKICGPILINKEWAEVYSVGRTSTELMSGQVGCIVYREKKTEPVLLPPIDSASHAFEVIEAIKGDTFDGDFISPTGSWLRLKNEVESAFNRGLTLTNTEITEVFMSESDDEEEAPVEAKRKKVVSDPEIPVPAWSSLKRPDDFWVDKDVWESLLWCGSNGDNALLLGPTGAGKTELCYRVNKALGTGIEPFNFGASQEARSMLIGNTHFNAEKGTFFKPSRFVTAIQERDGTILLDELTRCRDYSALNMILTLMDGQRYVALDEAEEAGVVYRGDMVAFMATANVGYEYTGTEAVDRALKDRFALKINLDYPPDNEEYAILLKRYPKVPKTFAKKLVDTARDQRNLAKEGEYEESISTRMMLDCCKCVCGGLNTKAAVSMTILGCFSQEGGAESQRFKLVQLIQKRASELV